MPAQSHEAAIGEAFDCRRTPVVHHDGDLAECFPHLQRPKLLIPVHCHDWLHSGVDFLEEEVMKVCCLIRDGSIEHLKALLLVKLVILHWNAQGKYLIDKHLLDLLAAV